MAASFVAGLGVVLRLVGNEGSGSGGATRGRNAGKGGTRRPRERAPDDHVTMQTMHYVMDNHVRLAWSAATFGYTGIIIWLVVVGCTPPARFSTFFFPAIWVRDTLARWRPLALALDGLLARTRRLAPRRLSSTCSSS